MGDERGAKGGKAFAGAGGKAVIGGRLARNVGAIGLRVDLPQRRGGRPLPFRAEPEHEVGLRRFGQRAFDADAFDMTCAFVAQACSVGKGEGHAIKRDAARQHVARGASLGRGDRGFGFDQHVE